MLAKMRIADVNGDERIRAAAREAGQKVRDDGAGDRKIRAAAAEAGYVDPGEAGAKILAAARASGVKVGNDGAGDQRIRRAAGRQDGDDALQKALSDLSSAVAAIGRPVSSPQRGPTAAARRPQTPRPGRSVAAPPRRPVPPPAPVRAPPPQEVVELPPLPILGPSRVEHDDGHHLAPVLGRYGFRDRLAADLRGKRVSPEPERIVQHATQHYGLGAADAAELAEWFLSHLQHDVERRC